MKIGMTKERSSEKSKYILLFWAWEHVTIKMIVFLSQF